MMAQTKPFDAEAETAGIRDPFTRAMCRNILEVHNQLWHGGW